MNSMDSTLYEKMLALLAFLLLAGLAKLIHTSLRNPLNAVPGPWYAIFTHLRLKLAVITGQRIHYVHALHQKYGPYVRIAPHEIAVNDAAGYKQIHGIGSGFEKHTWYEETTAFPMPVLFTMRDSKSHGVRRRLFGPGFAKTNIRRNWESAVKEKIVLAVKKMKHEIQKTGKADVLKWWTLMASDVSSTLLFGDSFHTLEQGEANQYIRTLTKALTANGIAAELPLLRIIGKKLPFQATNELFNTNEILSSYAKTAVRNLKSTHGNSSKNIFSNIQAAAEKGEMLQDEDVEAETMALFVAGTDTTAISLTYLVWAVLSRPQLRRQVEGEVATLPEEYADADVEKLPLVNAVIEETLRLYGAAPGALPRVVPAGGRDMGGYFIPQGTCATTHAYSAHRDPDLFRQPEEFRPSRWLVGSDDYLADAARAVYAPFGGGARACLGQHIAYSELRIGAAEFFRQLVGAKLAESVTDESMWMENFFLIAPKAHQCEVTV